MTAKQMITWAMLIWAIVSGCFVTDLWVCPWTAVFDPLTVAEEELP